MNYKDAFYKTVHDTPGGCEALAVRMGYSAGLLRNKANPNSTSNVLTVDDASRVMEITGNYEFLDALCRQHGRVCTKIETQPASDMAVLESVTDIWGSLGQVGTLVHTALADGRIDANEVQHIEKAIFVSIRPMMELLARLNGMAEK